MTKESGRGDKTTHCHSERSETKSKNLIKQIPQIPRDDKEVN